MKAIRTNELNSTPCLYSLLYLDREDKSTPDCVHHSYYAHGKLEAMLGHDIVRSTQTMPLGTYDVNVLSVDNVLIPAVFTTWMSDQGCYGLKHLGIVYLDGDKEAMAYAAEHLGRGSC